MQPRHLCLGPRPPSGDCSPLQGTYPSRARFSHRAPEVRGHYLQNASGLKPPKRTPLKTAALSSIRENPRNPRQNASFLPRISRIVADFRIGKSNSQTTPTRRPFRLPSGLPTFFPCRMLRPNRRRLFPPCAAEAAGVIPAGRRRRNLFSCGARIRRSKNVSRATVATDIKLQFGTARAESLAGASG